MKIKILMLFLVITFFFSIFFYKFTRNVFAEPNIYYVAKALSYACASDSNTGENPDCSGGVGTGPFATIQRAAEVVSGVVDTTGIGSTVYVRAGVYNEMVDLRDLPSGTNETGRIIFSAFPGEEPIIDGTGLICGVDNPHLSWGNGLFNVYLQQYVTVQGFIVRNTPTTNIGGGCDERGAAGIAVVDSQHIIIQNNSTDETGISGIFVWDNYQGTILTDPGNRPDDIKILNNDVQRATKTNSNEFITVGGCWRNDSLPYPDNEKCQVGPNDYLPGVWNVEIAGNTVHNGVYGSPDGPGIGIMVGSSSMHVQIHDNVVYDLNEDIGIYVGPYYGHEKTEDIDIYNNIVYSTGISEGISIVGEKNGVWNEVEETGGLVTDINVYNNLVYNVEASGISIVSWDLGGDGPCSKDNINIYNNTVYGSPTAGIQVIGWMSTDVRVSNVTITNNIVNSTPNYYDSLRVLLAGDGEKAGPATVDTIFENNIWGTWIDEEFFGVGGVECINCMQVVDPNTLFNGLNGTTCPVGSDNYCDESLFKLKETSPALNYDSTPATPFAVEDFDGNVRDSNPDLGAYEYGSAGNTAYTLNVLVYGIENGIGIINSSPSGINCGSDCSQEYNEGTTVTLTAVPDVSSSFTGWGGECSGTGTCVIAMNQARNVTATFTRRSFTVSFSAGANGSISGELTQTVYYGNSASAVNAFPNSGYNFVNWTGSGFTTSTSNPLTISNIISNLNITANFIVNNYILSVSKTTGGIVSSYPSGVNCTTTLCTGSFTENTSVTLSADPSTGYTFTGWGNGCTGTGICSVVMSSNINRSASFTINTYTIESSSGSNGIISPAGTRTVNYGDDVTYTITPSSGYVVRAVTVDGIDVGSVISYTFENVSSGHTITATFAVRNIAEITEEEDVEEGIDTNNDDSSVEEPEDDNTNEIGSKNTVITISTSGKGGVLKNGTIILGEDKDINLGDSVTYTFTPNIGYKILDVVVDGISVGAVSTYTFVNVQKEHTISIKFAEINPNSQNNNTVDKSEVWYKSLFNGGLLLYGTIGCILLIGIIIIVIIVRKKKTELTPE